MQMAQPRDLVRRSFEPVVSLTRCTSVVLSCLIQHKRETRNHD